MTKLSVLHVEDEPWNYDYIITELEETLQDEDVVHVEGLKIANDVIVSEPKEGKYPKSYSIDWTQDCVEFSITYCFVERVEQISKVENITDYCTFIIDVMHSSEDGQPVSGWRKAVQFLNEQIDNLDDQVRLYTNYELSDDAEEELKEVGEVIRDIEPPPKIGKGEAELTQFILKRFGSKVPAKAS